MSQSRKRESGVSESTETKSVIREERCLWHREKGSATLLG